MRFSSKTFKTFKRSLKKRSKKTMKKKQRGGCAGCSLYRGIPKEATFSDVMPNPLE
jgi:hypothetical protein